MLNRHGNVHRSCDMVDIDLDIHLHIGIGIEA